MADPKRFDPQEWIRRQRAIAETTSVPEPQQYIRTKREEEEKKAKKSGFWTPTAEAVSERWKNVFGPTVTEEVATNPAVSGKEFYKTPSGTFEQRDVKPNLLLKTLVTAPERAVRIGGATVGTVGDLLASPMAAYLKSPVAEKIGEAGKWFAQTPPGKGLYEVGSPIAEEVKKVIPKNKALRTTVGEAINLASVYPAGMLTQKIGTGMVKEYEKQAAKQIIKPVEKLYETAPKAVKEKLPGYTTEAGEKALKEGIVKFGLEKHINDPKALESAANELARKAVDKADLSLLKSASEIVDPMGTVKLKVELNPWEIAEKVIAEEKAKGTRGLFQEKKKAERVWKQLTEDLSGEWNSKKDVGQILQFKREVLNQGDDLFKRTDIIDPSERLRISLKKEIYHSINDELEKKSKAFKDLNQDAKMLHLIKDAAEKWKISPKSKISVPGAMIGGAAGGAAGGFLAPELSSISSMLGGGIGASLGVPLGMVAQDVLKYPFSAQASLKAGKTLSTLGQLGQLKKPVIPLSGSQQYLKELNVSPRELNFYKTLSSAKNTPGGKWVLIKGKPGSSAFVDYLKKKGIVK